jgi:signal peptidase II
MKIFKKKRAIDYLIYSSVILGVIALDLITKFLSYTRLSRVDTIPIIDGVIHFTYVENRGAAFGMLANHRWVFISISIVVISAFLLYLFLGHAENMLMGIAMSMISAGGLGNMVDRLSLGFVVDFIDFRLINFAVFNIADSFVCIGAGLMILYLVLEIIKEGKKNAA